VALEDSDGVVRMTRDMHRDGVWSLKICRGPSGWWLVEETYACLEAVQIDEMHHSLTFNRTSSGNVSIGNVARNLQIEPQNLRDTTSLSNYVVLMPHSPSQYFG
jgi:hypothetical protein